MNIAEVFVRRRVLAYMLSAAILLFGGIGLRDIGTDRLPNVNPPFITITTVYPGASPGVVDASITRVIESAINSVSDIERIESVSRPGLSEIFVKFSTSKDPDVAFNESQGKVNVVLNELPREAERPIIIKLDPNARPVMRIFLTGDRSLSELNQLARETVKKRLESVRGVGEVRVGGGRERKIRVDLDLNRLSALGLTAQDVIAAFGREHIQVPGGYLVGGNLEKLLYLDLEFHSIDELKEMVLASRSQVPVKLKHVARVSDGLDDKRAVARLHGREGITIEIVKVRDANTVAIVEAVEKVLDGGLRAQLPDGVELQVATRESDVINDVIDALGNHLLEGTLLAGLVVFLFLLNVPATLIISTAVPVSLAGAMVAMYFGGFTLNIFTLSGLLLLIGVVVDDAIVVLENIHRQHEAADLSSEEAAIRGTREVVMPVTAASLTLLCIFVPVVFADGVIGIFFLSFAIIVAVGVMVSLVVSLTLTPALCARFLTSHNLPENRLLMRLELAHQWLEKNYRRGLVKCLGLRWLVIITSAVVVVSSVWFLNQLNSEFIPEDDESRYQILLKTPLGSSIDYTLQKLSKVEAMVEAYPEVMHVLSTVGSARGGDVNEALLHITLLPKQNRTISQVNIMARTRADLANIAGLESFVSPTPIMDSTYSDPFQALIMGPDDVGIAQYAAKMHNALQKEPGMGDVKLRLTLSRPQLTFKIDRERAMALGINTRQIGDTIRVLAGGADIAKYNASHGDGERYDIQLKALHRGMREARDIQNVYLKGDDGQLVSMGSVVTIEESTGPTVIERTDLQYSAGFSSTPVLAQSEAARIFSETAEAILPEEYSFQFSGQTEEMGRSVNTLLFLFLTGLTLIYMLLASQFNSFMQPALIMLAQPLAIVGGLLALWLTGSTLNIFSMIGLLLLIGLVSKNSILLVDLINQYRSKGMTANEAILAACPRRMRPVLMTSMTIVLAMLPAALGVGAGAGLYGPLAVAVIGGIISSTLLTLIVVPVAYSLLDRWLTTDSTGQ